MCVPGKLVYLYVGPLPRLRKLYNNDVIYGGTALSGDDRNQDSYRNSIQKWCCRWGVQISPAKSATLVFFTKAPAQYSSHPS